MEQLFDPNRSTIETILPDAQRLANVIKEIGVIHGSTQPSVCHKKGSKAQPSRVINDVDNIMLNSTEFKTTIKEKNGFNPTELKENNVAQLREQLQLNNLGTTGLKADLVERLETYNAKMNNSDGINGTGLEPYWPTIKIKQEKPDVKKRNKQEKPDVKIRIKQEKPDVKKRIKLEKPDVKKRNKQEKPDVKKRNKQEKPDVKKGEDTTLYWLSCIDQEPMDVNEDNDQNPSTLASVIQEQNDVNHKPFTYAQIKQEPIYFYDSCIPTTTV
jgi:SAP domain